MMNAPADVAKNYVGIGVAKVNTPISKMIFLGIMAGMFIALAAVGCNTAASTIANPSLAKFLGASVFPVGLIMTLVAGSELFTGNTLIVIPLLERKVSFGGMIKNWIFVYIGNLIGSLIVVLIVATGIQWGMFGGDLAVTTMKVAATKINLGFGPALALGIGCNFLVCIAVWLSFAAKDVAGKVLGIYMPIMLFVLAGFEHCVANMYFVPAGIVAAMNDKFMALAVDAGVKNLDTLTWGNFFAGNLLPVTIGNIIGGSILVGCIYWFCYLKKPANK